MKTVTLKNQLACAQRELAKRERMYPKWIREGRLNPHVAEHEIAAMAHICQTLEKLVGLEETTVQMKADYRAKHPEHDPEPTEVP